MLRALFIAVIVGGIAYILWPASSGFSDQDIEAAQKSIKEEFSKRPGITVTEVKLLKENSKKLMGFAKLKAFNIEITKACTATMGEGGQYMWKCD